MKIKETIKHIYMHFKYYNNYINNIDNVTQEKFEEIIQNSNHKDVVLCTIAFENPEVIMTQIIMLKKNLKDKYLYFVADNSNNTNRAIEIERVCNEYNVIYIKLPNNPYNGRMGLPSYSNGSAMNYIYMNLMSKCKTINIGFLDHDIFPIKKCSIIDYLNEQKFWGVIRCVPSEKYNKLSSVYLWAGFCFYRKDYLDKLVKIDFMPKKGIGDTGSANYHSLYYPIIKTDEFLEYHFADLKRVNIEGVVGSPQSSQYEIINGSWIHYLNASNWSNEDIGVKEKMMNELMNEYLK